MDRVSVTYHFQKKDGTGGSSQTTETIEVNGKTESAILENLRKRKPDYEFVIYKIEWRN
jgi:hypothetical protein